MCRVPPQVAGIQIVSLRVDATKLLQVDKTLLPKWLIIVGCKILFLGHKIVAKVSIDCPNNFLFICDTQSGHLIFKVK